MGPNLRTPQNQENGRTKPASLWAQHQFLPANLSLLTLEVLLERLAGRKLKNKHLASPCQGTPLPGRGIFASEPLGFLQTRAMDRLDLERSAGNFCLNEGDALRKCNVLWAKHEIFTFWSASSTVFRLLERFAGNAKLIGERLAGRRARGTLAVLERYAGASREVRWQRPREVPWQEQRGALAKIERCAGNLNGITFLFSTFT